MERGERGSGRIAAAADAAADAAAPPPPATAAASECKPQEEDAQIAGKRKAGEDVQGEGLPHPDPAARVCRGRHVLQVPSAAQVHAVSVPELEGLPARRGPRGGGRPSYAAACA